MDGITRKAESIITVEDIIDDVKKNGEEILGRPLTKKEVEYASTSMISDFYTHLYDKGFFDTSKEYTSEDEQADKDFFDETFYDNLKSVLPEVIDQIQEEAQKEADDRAYKAHLKETFPKDLKGFNRSNDINGNAVLKAFYKDGSTEMVRGGKVEDFYQRYNKSWSDREKFYKTIDGLRKSSLNNSREHD